MTQRRETFSIGDRRVEVSVGGADEGPVILVHHGTPMSPELYADHERDAEQRGARLVSVARPGYAGSSRRTGRRVASVVEDVAVVLDALDADRFVTWGISGGGPHALACAAGMPERCAAAASIAGVAPYDAAGLDFLAGMGEDNVEEFGLALRGEGALRPWLETQREQMLAADSAAMIEVLRSILSPADQAAFTAQMGDYLVRVLQDGVRTGVDGWVDDDVAFTGPWGFAVGSIERPVQVWQGRADRMVPFAHGEWLAAQLPHADVRLSDTEGHLTLLARVPEAHAWLLTHL